MAAGGALVAVPSLESEMAIDGAGAGIYLSVVMKTSIRYDIIVSFILSNISKNSRQPYAESRKAGDQTSGESFGTCRAVSRIARVPCGGSIRPDLSLFRGGRTFSPPHIWHRWCRKLNVNHKRYAADSAIAPSSVPSLRIAPLD